MDGTPPRRFVDLHHGMDYRMTSRIRVPLSQRQVPGPLIDHARHPLVVVMGSPAEVVNLLKALPPGPTTCFQMDMHQGHQVFAALKEAGIDAAVEVLGDLWDLPEKPRTAVYLPARSGERDLKIDLVEQAYQVLPKDGQFVVWSSESVDRLFPDLLKKVFKKVHSHATPSGHVMWAVRGDDKPRRTRELAYRARVKDVPSQFYVSRPGVFGYGKFDNGARALAEIAEIRPGDRILDMGCGNGSIGVMAGLQAGPGGSLVFADSSPRALELARRNATAAGLTNFQTALTCDFEEDPNLPEDGFDVVLANPPYFAGGAISRMFVNAASRLLRSGGRFYLVTRQPDEPGEAMGEAFGEFDAIMNRGYTVLMVDPEQPLRPIPPEPDEEPTPEEQP
ncbi:MAG: methyltransferase [Planctomycetes bacterium]|nr:methyltransferase [Planctomycetota bacterium]